MIEPGSIRTPLWDKVQRTDRAFVRGTAYQRMLEAVWERALDGGPRGLPAERAAEAVCTALNARRPPVRIAVVRSRLGAVLRCLSDRWIDSLNGRGLRRASSLNRR